MEGIIVELHDGSVTIDFRGRMGQIKLPLRMLIIEYPLALGQCVGFVMSYPEVLGPEIDENFLSIQKHERKKEGGE